ncbi:hypothetical protein [Promicromonospora umidemergens]|uniref:hypothetical protein n=1 Tax=Promicromonospora umidemergens TaxID=629679 RepID=UPI0020A4A241|nr:hypothetical protein [Promicromonospora umidemergens]
MTAVAEAPVEAPTSTVVRLWCGTCHALVPIRPTRASQRPRGPVVQHVTPAAWADHRATHTTTKGAE